MKKHRSIFAVLGGLLVLGVSYVLASAATLVALALPFEVADRREVR